MPTYVAQPQASRTGLIATIVIFCITTILMTVLFFVRDTEAKKTQIDLDAFKTKYADVVTPAALAGEEYQKAKDAAKDRSKSQHAPVSVFDLQNQQKNELTAVITGQAQGAPEAVNSGKFATEQGNAALGKYAGAAETKVAPAASLVDALSKWPAVADKLISQRDDLKRQLASKEEAIKTAEAAHQTALAEKDKQIADAKAETAKANEQVVAYQKTQETNLAGVKTGADQSIATLQQQMQAVQGQLAQINGNLATVTKERDYLKQVLRRFKVNHNPEEDIIRVPDGVIATVAGNECFINIGEGDQVSRGMTFEVYDPNKGIPKLSDDAAAPVVARPGAAGGSAAAGAAAKRVAADKYEFELPKGKGSIEVTSVGPGHQSRARIVHVEEGQTISQGDLIANLVYDRNIKFNFVTYGDFDLSGSGNVNSRANDAPVIRRLIEQWGGNVQPITDPAKPADAVTADTDFVIVGREPVIPSFSAEELNDPNNQAILDRAKAKAAAYQAVLGKAAEFGIPVLNQNRFLYYVGYFDLAKR